MQKAKFLNKETIIEQLSKIAAEVKSNEKNIIDIILFGSLVENTYTGLSDADLLVILKESNLRFVDRIPKFLIHFLNSPVPVDIFPYTEEETKNIPFAKRAISEGIIL